MKLDIWKAIQYTTFVLCLLATIILSVYSIIRYFANEDVTLIHISKYQSSEDSMYPSHSICILPPFLEHRFKRYQNDGINMTSYVQFLKGKIWDDRMLDIDYDYVTVSLSENLRESFYLTQNRSKQDWKPVHFTSFRSATRKCFTVKAPFIENELFWNYGNAISNSIFPNGRRSAKNKIYIYLHYPGQRCKAYYTIKFRFDSRENKTKNYRMDFRVKNVDVISRRNKPQEPCILEWKNFDENVMNDMAMQAGCRPKYWNLSADVPICTQTIQMKQFSDQPLPGQIESLSPPCKSIDRLDYVYEEADLDDEADLYTNKTYDFSK